jgi:arylsulfatase A-like enzyme
LQLTTFLSVNGVIKPIPLIIFFVALSISGCTSKPAGPERDVPVIIYLVDTLRADRLGVYGYEKRATSPHIDAFAEDSVVFTDAYAPAPWTLPSVMSLVTSRFPCEHGVITGLEKPSPDLRFLAERFKEIGYLTGIHHLNGWVGGPLYRGYDEAIWFKETDQAAWIKDANGFLARAGDEPFYLYLHTMEPHGPENTPQPFVSRFDHVNIDDRKLLANTRKRLLEASFIDSFNGQALGTTINTDLQIALMATLAENRDSIDILYDTSVLWADDNLGHMIDLLKEKKLWDEAIFIFVADHGEGFGEHGRWFHSNSAYEEVMRIPLIIHFPNSEFGGLQVETPVSLIDIMPTIFDYLGVPELCADCRGTSLVKYLNQTATGRDSEARIQAMRLNRVNFFQPWKDETGDSNFVARQGHWKAIWNSDVETLELYDLESDPGEQNDVAADNPEHVDELRNQIIRFERECRSRAPTNLAPVERDEDQREQIRAMGYFE